MHSSTTLERGRSSQIASTCAREQAQKVGAAQRKGVRSCVHFSGTPVEAHTRTSGLGFIDAICWGVRHRCRPEKYCDGIERSVGSARTLEQQRGARGAPGREHEAATDVGLALAAE